MKTKMVILLCLVLIICGCGRSKGHKPTERLFPPTEQSKVSGTGSFFNVYHASIYNGSNWTITRVVLTIIGKSDWNANILWTRDFCAYPTMGRIRPLTAETCIVELPARCQADDGALMIKEVYGYKQ
jgi:hypothetical protein